MQHFLYSKELQHLQQHNDDEEKDDLSIFRPLCPTIPLERSCGDQVQGGWALEGRTYLKGGELNKTAPPLKWKPCLTEG